MATHDLRSSLKPLTGPGTSPCQQGRLGGGQEPSGHQGGSGVCGAASGFRVCGCQVGAERDAADVVDAGPRQPVLEVGLLEVVAEARAAVGAVDRAGLDDCDPLVLQ